MKPRNIILPLLAGVLVLAALLSVTGRMLAAPAGPTVVEKQRAALEHQLAGASDSAARALLSEKVIALQGLEAMRATGIAIAPTKSANACANRPLEGEESFPTGVLNGPESVLPGRDMVVLNGWQGLLDGQRISVLAAYPLEDSSQSLIVVSSYDSAWGGEVPAPAGSGELRIRAEQDGLLALENADGQRYWFDPAGLQFVEGPGSVFAPVIPAPTYTPAPSPCEG